MVMVTGGGTGGGCDDPTALDDTYTTCGGVDVTLSPISNDVYTGTPTISIVNAPSQGNLSLSGTHDYTYTPGVNFTGGDVFTYQLCDDCECTTGVITVNSSGNVPDASFTFDDTASPTIAFSDASTDATSWSWNFGDGNSSTDQNPTHTYASTGLYTVCLTATSSCGSDTYCDIINVTFNCPRPVVNDDQLNVCKNSFGTITVTNNDQFVQSDPFSPTGQINILSGPNHGTVGSLFTPYELIYSPNPNYAGTDEIEYEICDLCGCDTGKVLITVHEDKPEVDFFFSPSIGGNPTEFDFVSLSQGATSYLWDFDDGTTSTATNPTHDFGLGNQGLRNVCLTATNSCGSKKRCKLVDPNLLCTVPEAVEDEISFCSVNTDPSQPSIATTFDVSTNDTHDGTAIFTLTSSPSYGSASISPAGVVTYHANTLYTGTDQLEYEMCDGCGCTTGQVNIDVGNQPRAMFATSSVSGNTLSLSNSSTGLGLATWDFGDGNTSTDWDPTHSYATPGTYAVCLSITNDCDTDAMCQNVTVGQLCVPPVAVDDREFTCIDPTSGIAPPITIDVMPNDTPQVNDYNVNLTSQPSGGTVLESSLHSGIFIYIPAVGFSGWDSFTYELCNDCGCSTATVEVLVGAKPEADFTYSVDDQNPLKIDFQIILGPMHVDLIDWDFGNGQTGFGNSISHTYAMPGTYTVCVEVSNECGSHEQCYDIEVGQGCNDPIARNDNITICPPVNGPIMSTNVSVIGNDTYVNTPTVSIITNLTHGTASVSNMPGVITIQPDTAFAGKDSFKYEIDDGCGTSTAWVYVTFPPKRPDASFTVTQNGMQVTLTGNPQPGVTWKWDFGNGVVITTNGNTITYTYPQPGFYRISAFVINQCNINDIEFAHITLCGRDGYEANDTRATATPISTLTTLRALICPEGDVDWYKLVIEAARPNVYITLSSLPKNYDMFTYNASGGLLKLGNNAGTADETIIHNGLVGGLDYYVKVEGANLGGNPPSSAFHPTDTYILSVQSRGVQYVNSQGGDTPDEAEEENEANLFFEEVLQEIALDDISFTQVAAPAFVKKPQLNSYPNPFEDVTNIVYHLPEDATVSLSIHNVFGQEIAKLIDHESHTEGDYSQSFDSMPFPTGMYYCILTVNNEQIIHKLVVSR